MKLSTSLLACIAALSLNAAEPTIITLGNTKPIHEIDITKLIQERISEVASYYEKNQQEISEDFKKRLKNYRPPNLSKLNPANEDSVRLVDVSYTLEQDIKDGLGQLLYPKGYTFNPLDYQSLGAKYIVFNAANPLELEWFMASPYAKSFEYTIMLTDGNYYHLMEQIKRPVYFLPAEVTERFQLYHTVSFIEQKGKKIEVREKCIKCLAHLSEKYTELEEQGLIPKYKESDRIPVYTHEYTGSQQ